MKRQKSARSGGDSGFDVEENKTAGQGEEQAWTRRYHGHKPTLVSRDRTIQHWIPKSLRRSRAIVRPLVKPTAPLSVESIATRWLGKMMESQVSRMFIISSVDGSTIAVIFIHGGPGGGCGTRDRCFFNPEIYSACSSFYLHQVNGS